MVYVNNKNINLEMRVLEHDKSEIDGISIKATWIIIDINKKIVLYQSNKGNNLYKPPMKGWKRLIDSNEYHYNFNKRGGDLEMDIISKEFKYGSIPSPEIISLKHNKNESILIEYDYKKLILKDVPYLKQWIEIIAHNITYPEKDDIFQIIYIDNNDEVEKKAYDIFTENKEILKTNINKKLQKLDWIRTSFEFNNLLLDSEYKFTIKLSNCISYTESNLSNLIIPMTLPSKGIINNIFCNSYKRELYINYEYDKIFYENKSMNPISFNLIIKPWPLNNNINSFKLNNNNSYVIDEDNKKIIIAHEGILNNNTNIYNFEKLIISNIIFGQIYNIQLETENEIGINKTDIYSYCPVCIPPKPIIKSIETDDKNWNMTINILCDGYDKKECQAWFEIDLIDPGNNDENENKIELMSDIDEDGNFIENKSSDIEIDEKEKELSTYKSKLDKGIIEILNQKHYKSPIILKPIFAGQTYIIRIKCVNICCFTESIIYNPIFIKTIPTKPIFTNYQSFDGSCVISYKCPNYKYYFGYEPIFELKISPHNKQQPLTKLTKQRIENLRNGYFYNFKIRAKNKLGQSEWSQNIKLKPLKKPQIPTNLITISGNKCITIFWLSSDNMEDPNINGKFLIISQPTTIEQKIINKNKIEFQALDNDKYYKFKVIAINNNFRIESQWTQQVKPDPKKSKSIYNQEKLNAEDEIKKIYRKKLLEMKKNLRISKGGGNTPTFSTKYSNSSPRKSPKKKRVSKKIETPQLNPIDSNSTNLTMTTPKIPDQTPTLSQNNESQSFDSEIP